MDSWTLSNPLTNWYSPDVIGIDVGITLLMAEKTLEVVLCGNNS